MKVSHATYALVSTLHHTTPGGLKLAASVSAGRVVFTGGKFGPHSLDAGASSADRVLAHWEGYCAASDPTYGASDGSESPWGETASAF